jgi:pyrroloquinoline quinone (PQQ) biosynthesis protein C
MLFLTEDSGLVRRRGRWVTTKVIELYLQEVLYTKYTQKLPRVTRERIERLAGAFPFILKKALAFLHGAIPAQVSTLPNR